MAVVKMVINKLSGPVYRCITAEALAHVENVCGAVIYFTQSRRQVMVAGGVKRDFWGWIDGSVRKYRLFKGLSRKGHGKGHVTER